MLLSQDIIVNIYMIPGARCNQILQIIRVIIIIIIGKTMAQVLEVIKTGRGIICIEGWNHFCSLPARPGADHWAQKCLSDPQQKRAQ